MVVYSSVCVADDNVKRSMCTLKMSDVFLVHFVINTHARFPGWCPNFHIKTSAGQPKGIVLQHVGFRAMHFDFFEFFGTRTGVSLSRNNSKCSIVEVS